MGNLFAEIEMNIILSIPKIISKNVSVNSATQVSIWKNNSMIYFILYTVPFCLNSENPILAVKS